MKTTRSNFARKAITFGVVVFISIALVATGFAAWLISANTEHSESSNINVVTVSNANIEINLNNLEGSTLAVKPFYFAPEADDDDGAIKHTSDGDATKDSNQPENLSFDFSGSVKNGNQVGKLTFSIKVKESVINAAGFFKVGDNWTYDASRAYISLPSYAVAEDGSGIPTLKPSGDTYVIDTENMTAPVELNITGALTSTGVQLGGFTFKYDESKPVDQRYIITGNISLGWGEAFGFGNPGRTLDPYDTYDFTGKTSHSVVDPLRSKSEVVNEAQLYLLLVNYVVSGVEIGGDAYKNLAGANVITSGTINASSISVKDIASNSSILGSTATEKVNNLIEALMAVQTNSPEILAGTEYTLVITAQPK